jgi:flagellar motor switch protein FliG
MTQQRRFQDEILKIESERTIQMMESELEYHRKMSMIFESSLVSEQEHLSRIVRRQQATSQMRNNMRNTFRHSRGDDSQ